MTGDVRIPLDVRLRFGRAAVQTVADHVGVDLLHIKGDAVDPSLRVRRFGSDVDIMVRPSQVDRLDEAITAEGWRLYSSFDFGSPFGHAQTYSHELWGYLDLHRRFPGARVDDSAAFDILARGVGALDAAGVTCPVPAVSAQAALLLLNASRAGGSRHPDVRLLWGEASRDDRAKIRAVVAELRAEVAFSAAVGGLDHYRGRPDYTLWKVVAEGGARSAEWRARVRAAPTRRDALRVLARAPRVNIERLTHELGREPSRREIFVASIKRPTQAVVDSWNTLRRNRT